MAPIRRPPIPDPPAVAALDALVAEDRAIVMRRVDATGASIECYAVEEDGDRTRIYRRAWWLDEESRTWELDVTEVWELDPAVARFLLAALSR